LLHAELSAGQLLRAQRCVGDRHVAAHAEHAILLVERRHAEALVGRRAQIGGGRRVIERGDPSARNEALDVVEGLVRGYAGRRRGVVAWGMVAVPVVAAGAPDDLRGGDGCIPALQETTADELLAASVAGAHEGTGVVHALVGLALHPARIAA